MSPDNDHDSDTLDDEDFALCQQAGTTTRQMLQAPVGAIYVWCNGNLHYPRGLAKHLGRDDLQVVPSSWLMPSCIATHGVVVVDHAMYEHRFGPGMLGAIAALRQRGRLHDAVTEE